MTPPPMVNLSLPRQAFRLFFFGKFSFLLMQFVWQEISTPKVSNTLSTVEAAHSIRETNSSPKETYTPQRALELFNRYAKEDDKTVMQTEEFLHLCTDANIANDGALPLILSWQMGSKEMGKITKDEWVTGTSSLRCVLCCLSCLLVLMAIEFLRYRCCRWLRLNLRICSFVVVHQLRRRVKRTITTDLPITRMLEMWKLVSTNSICSATRLPSRSKHILCDACGSVSLESCLILFQSRQSKNLDMEVTSFCVCLSAKIENLKISKRPLWLFGLFFWVRNILLWRKLFSLSTYAPLLHLCYLFFLTAHTVEQHRNL